MHDCATTIVGGKRSAGRSMILVRAALACALALASLVFLPSAANATVGTAWTNPDGSTCNGQAFLLKEQPAADRAVTALDLSNGQQGAPVGLTGGVGFNAVGFNEGDQQLYGTYRVDTGGSGAEQPATTNGTIWRISADGTYEQVALSGPGVTAPNAANNGLGSLPQLSAPSYPIGDFDEDGTYWVAARQSMPGGGFRTGPLYQIQITPGTATQGPAGTVISIVSPDANVGLSDFTYVEGTDSFWSISDIPQRSLISISRSGVVTNHGAVGGLPAAQYVGMYADSNKNIYALQMGSGDVYGINRTGVVESGVSAEAVKVTNIGAIGNGDAAQCGLIPPLPGLSFGKVVDKPAAAHGDVLTYTLTVQNIGFTDLVDVPVTDTIGAGSTYLDGSATLDGAPAGTYTGPAPGRVSWTIPALGRGDTATLTLQVKVDPGFEPGTIVNRMVAAYPPGTPPGTPPPDVDNPCEDDPTRSCAVTEVPGVGKIEFGKVVDRTTAAGGDTLTYTVTVANVGGLDASDVAVSDELPPGVTFVSADNGGVEADGLVSWTIPALAAGESVDLEIVVTAPTIDGPQTLVNRVSVDNPPGFEPPTVDAPCADDPTKSCATTVIPGIGELAFGKVVDAPTASPGDTLTYTVTVANTGTLDAVDVVVTDELPDGVTFVSADKDGVYADRVVTWTIASLPVGAEVDLQITATVDVDAGGTLVNRVSVDNPPGFEPPVVKQPCTADPTESCAPTTVTVTSPGPQPPATPPGQPSPDPLASTGVEAGGHLWLAAMLVLSGAALVALGRRRRA